MLLEPGKIGSLELVNRIIFAPHGTHLEGPGGEVTEELIDYYVRRVQGGAALIEAGVIHAVPSVAPFNLGKLRISNTNFLSGLAKLVETVHEEGGKIAVQLAAGRGDGGGQPGH